jgi:hypothetical protein
MALTLYGAVVLVGFGRRIIIDPAHACACQGSDPSGYMWNLAWWPHAIWHGANPFITHAVWGPGATDLAKTAAIPLAALVLSPITELFGPIVSYNVLTLLAPILAAFTAYLLCRRIVGRFWPALMGGYLFGFSSYMLAQLTQHANLFLVFLVPVAVHLALRRGLSEVSRRRYVASLAIVFLAQLGLSTEVLSTMLLMGAIVLIAAAALTIRSGGRVLELIGETVLAGLIAAAIASPFLYYALFSGGSPEPPPGAPDYGNDVFDLFVPTMLQWIHGGAVFLGGHWAEIDGYVSVPLLLAFAVWVDRQRRRLLARLTLAAFLAALVLSLGSLLFVNGNSVAELEPYTWLGGRPIFDSIEPTRIMMYALLAVAVGIADWLAGARGETLRPRARAWRWAVVLGGVVLLLPNLGSGLWYSKPPDPAFFTSPVYRSYLKRGERVLLLPYGQTSFGMLWQAQTHMYFNLAGGYLGDFTPHAYAAVPATGELQGGGPVSGPALTLYLRRFSVSHVIALPGGPYETLLISLGLTPVRVAGVELFAVPASIRGA